MGEYEVEILHGPGVYTYYQYDINTHIYKIPITWMITWFRGKNQVLCYWRDQYSFSQVLRLKPVYQEECNCYYLLMFSAFRVWKPIRLKAMIYPTKTIQTKYQEFKHTLIVRLSKAQAQPTLAIQPYVRFIIWQLQLKWKYSLIWWNAKKPQQILQHPKWKAFMRHYSISVVINSTLYLKNTNCRLSFSNIKYSNISLIFDNKSWNSLLRQKFCLQDHILL